MPASGLNSASCGSRSRPVLAAAVCYAAGSVYTQRAIPDVPRLATAAAAMTVSAIAMIPFAVTAGFPVPDATIALWLVVLAVATTGGALVLFYALIRSGGGGPREPRRLSRAAFRCRLRQRFSR